MLRIILRILIMWTLLFSFSAECGEAAAEDKGEAHMVGVMPFMGQGVDDQKMKAITERFRTEIFRLSKFNLIEQEKIESRMQEIGFRKTQCAEVSCYVDVGKSIGVDRMLFGQVTKIGNVVSIGIRLIDVQTGRILKSTTADTKADMERILSKILPELAEKIAGKASALKGVYSFETLGKREPVAVLNLDANGITEAESKGLTDRLRVELLNTGKFEVMERDKMATILQEQGFQKTSACTDQSCLVEAGQLIGVKYIIGGSVTKIPTMYTVSARIIDVETGKIVHTATEDTKRDLSEVLQTTTRDVARGLAGLKKIRKPLLSRWYILGPIVVAGTGAAGYALWAKEPANAPEKGGVRVTW